MENEDPCYTKAIIDSFKFRRLEKIKTEDGCSGMHL